jgi:DNA-binding response OmpR family regulator
VKTTTSQISGPARRHAVHGERPRTYRAEGSPSRILLIDDERTMTDLIRLALRDEGWEMDEELVARLRRLLRGLAHLTPAADEVLTVGDLELDDASRTVTRAGSPISLTSTEFDLLRVLMRHPRRALRRQEILDRVWNYDFGGRTGIVDLYISYLRKKVDAGRAPMIHTVRGFGYLLRPAE